MNNQATKFLEEFQTASVLMGPLQGEHASQDIWQPPPPSIFKLNFDAALFSALNSSGFGVVIWNEKGEVMVVMVAKGPEVDAGFSELVIEGDNSSVMKAISTLQEDFSLLGNVIGDIHHLVWNLQWVRIECTRHEGNRVAHELAQFARNISQDLFWMEYVPPIAREALYQDVDFSN